MVLEFEHDKIKGLTEKEARVLINRDGYNEIAGTKNKSFTSIIWEIIKEPMLLLLIACGILYLFLGDIGEALMLVFCVFIMIGINVYQENKTEKTLEALRDLSSPRALVIRDGEKKRIAGREVVLGDILILSEGDKVPADAKIISCSNLKVDESLLTGESVPVEKSEANSYSNNISREENLSFVYSGTLIVSGTCVAKVISIGMNTEMGKIGKSLQTLTTEKTSLQKEVNVIVKYFFIWGIISCSAVVLLYGFMRGGWLDGILTGLALAMSLLPEEFPIVLTIFLALGAWRMSKKNVLVRKQHAIQSLGSATVLCVDKTGTLTLNQMSIKKIYSNNKYEDLSKDQLSRGFYRIIETGILSSQKDPFDPMEKALKNLGKKFNIMSDVSSLKSIKDFSMSKEIMATSEVWKIDKRGYIVATKGTPEAIMDLCHLKKIEKLKLHKKIEEMALGGLRVIGVARAETKKITGKESVHDFKFKFEGLLGFEDPVRPNVDVAIKECYNAGIKIMMITGDYPATAKNIASQIGMVSGEIITGKELDSFTDDQLRERISNISIFARVVPEQKLRIVEALKHNGEIVAMTGDGVNDAPALKAANVGVAMGMRGTDVAREASGIVILDDDFSSIVSGVRSGRRIFDNIRKAMSYVFSIHFPIVGITLAALVFNWPLILLPAHIVFLELIIDPACSIVFESGKESPEIMSRRPRSPKEKIFNKKTMLFSIAQGVLMLVTVLMVFMYSSYLGVGDNMARTITFATLIILNLLLIVSDLSWNGLLFSNFENKYLIYIIFGAIMFLFLTIYVPFLNDLFLFDILGMREWGVVLLAGTMAMLGFTIFKKKIKIE